MNTPKPPMQVFISLILITSMFSTGFVLPVFAQRSRPIVITFGQPNIWSLEQAHYLLARMHRQNLDLQTAPLGSLDPNAANASRIEILKTLLQAGVSFDQAVGVNNEMLRRDKEFNSDRRRQLLDNRSTLQSQSTQLARDISSLRTDKPNAATEAEKTQIQASIDAKTDEKAAVDNELTQTNDELKNLTSASGDFQSAKVPEFSNSTITGDLDKLISKVELVNPSLAATLRLDNHIQLQYELISKQLTLLRDEVGPGERLVFLELPQSINARNAKSNPDEQVFVLPVPGGSGDGAHYYVTGVRYSPFQEPGSRMVVSIQGQNLPSQVGIFVNGVPLREAVGLGQLNIESILGDEKTRDNCAGPICGRFERIDANEIVLSFKLAPDFEGTPRIGLIGPGRSIVINRLDLTVNGVEDTQLDSADAMFGSPPDSTLRRITDFKVAPTGPHTNKMRGVLTGSKFKSDDKIYINGSLVPPPNCRKDLCIVEFDAQETDYLTVTISPVDPKGKVVSKTFLNPTNLSIISASVVNFEPGEGTRPAVLTVKLDGSGFREDLIVSVIKSEGPPPDRPNKIVASAGQMFLKIVNPEAAVHIKVTDPSNNRVVSAIVVRPQAPPPEEK